MNLMTDLKFAFRQLSADELGELADHLANTGVRPKSFV